jgi:hypothetical protein
LALVSVAGCGGSQAAEASTTQDVELDVGNRSLTPPCAATYIADSDITVVVTPWSDALMLGVVLPGDGWEGACSEGPGPLLAAEAEALMRRATVTVDTGVLGDVNVVEYANGQAAHTLEALRAQGLEVTASEPQHVGDTLLQLHVHHVIPTASGLLRYHLSELGDDPATMNEHAATLLNAVRAFALTRR